MATTTGIASILYLTSNTAADLPSDHKTISDDFYQNMAILLSDSLSAEQLLEPSKKILRHGPEGIAEITLVFGHGVTELPDRYYSLDGEREAVDLVRKSEKIKAYLLDHQVQAVFLPLSTHKALKSVQQHSETSGLACFDMDSTLIEQEVIDLLARSLGPAVEKEVSDITAQAMRGEIDFQVSLTERCKLLRGVPVSIWKDLERQITITPGAVHLIETLKRNGWRTAVLSGGFAPLASWLKSRLGLDHAFANNLLVSDDGSSLTGELDPMTPIVDGEAKKTLMQSTADMHGIPHECILAVGDGANDLLMLSGAGLGLAFNAKPKVKSQAPAALDLPTLSDILFILGHEHF
ncbi:MAG: hypothetical protein M1821_005146 [Bathelium mastoideum]|nr:MAG: hypothetical protein M1821_005146 [Bathelium mastoideum]KAI9677797.1 MAG: hypothetical protein M1822_008109 [Bathelium mastoideum]